MSENPASPNRSLKRGKLRIGNDWNAMTIIALSRSNPLKAVAELVENSIDARATAVSITRGRSERNYYLEIRDDGQGIPRDAEGRPDFRSRYDTTRNVIIVNNGHRDFVYVARTRALKLRYLIRLYAKVLVLKTSWAYHLTNCLKEWWSYR